MELYWLWANSSFELSTCWDPWSHLHKCALESQAHICVHVLIIPTWWLWSHRHRLEHEPEHELVQELAHDLVQDLLHTFVVKNSDLALKKHLEILFRFIWKTIIKINCSKYFLIKAGLIRLHYRKTPLLVPQKLVTLIFLSRLQFSTVYLILYLSFLRKFPIMRIFNLFLFFNSNLNKIILKIHWLRKYFHYIRIFRRKLTDKIRLGY